MDGREGEIGPDNRTPYRRGGPIAVERVKQRYYRIQPVEGATKGPRPQNQDVRRREFTEFKGGGVAFMEGFDGLALLESTLPTFCESYNGLAVTAVLVVTGTPLKL